MIHRSERLQEILCHLKNCTGDIVIYPLWPAPNKPAKRIIIQARKNTGGALRLSQGIVLHDGFKKYTPEVESILRDAQGIIL
jgi:tRNA1(Val) A37 N6-methylase TrmN6